MDNFIMSNMTVDDLASRICDLVSKKFIEQNETNITTQKGPKKLLTTQQVSDKYGLSNVSIWKLRKQGILPFIRGGKRRVLFVESEIETALKNLAIDILKVHDENS